MLGTHPSGKFVLYSDAMQEIEKRDRLVAEKDLMYRNVLGTYQRLCVEWGERGDQIAALEAERDDLIKRISYDLQPSIAKLTAERDSRLGRRE